MDPLTYRAAGVDIGAGDEVVRLIARLAASTRRPEVLGGIGAFAAFAVGVVERGGIITGALVRPGDRVLGLASSGLHSNGYTLARKIIFERMGLKTADVLPGVGRTVADELLEPTRIYVKPVLSL